MINYISKIYHIILILLLTAISNSYLLIKENPNALYIMIPLFVLINMFGSVFDYRFNNFRFNVCNHGVKVLKLFFTSTLLSIIIEVYFALKLLPDNYMDLIFSILVCYVTLSIVFWNGMMCVYLTSYQLGIKYRILCALYGIIPILQLWGLRKIIKVASDEIKFEIKKDKLNKARKEKQICKTKYPILLVHGVFFRDNKYFNYWGRIPKELQYNGATIYYGEHSSASSIEESAKELANRIKNIISETGCEKLNIIAHSKGGLDCRYAIKHFDISNMVASLITINTPHRGCEYADFLLNKISQDVQEKIAETYNKALWKISKEKADFMSAVNDLTASKCMQLDEECGIPQGIYCQSFGSEISKASGGQFPLNISYSFVKMFDGPNDGLVAESSFKWGEDYTYIKPEGKRGISHGDMIDLSRINIEDFDVRELYVDMVSKLKAKGL